MEIAAHAPLSVPGSAGAAPGRWALFLVSLAVIATAFNDLAGILPIGELSNDAFIYVAPLIFLYLARTAGAIRVPVIPLALAIALYMVIVIGIALNYEMIRAASFKGRGGFGRVITQVITITFGLTLAMVFYNLANRGFLPTMSRGARVALLIMAGVGLLELASWYAIPGLTQIHRALAGILHANSGAEYGSRLRTTAFEVSWAGVMLTFLFPFALLGLSPRDPRRPAYVALVVVLVVLTRSRTAMLVIGGQGLLLAWSSLRGRFDLVTHLLTATCLVAVIVALSPQGRDEIGTRLGNLVQYGSFVKQDEVDRANVSNMTRLAAINAGVAMFRDHPIFGVGLGQYGFNYPRYLSSADFLSWEVRKYATSAEPDWPPIFSLHIRILAELGVTGYAIWLALIAPALWRSARAIDAGTLRGRAHLAVAMTLAGWALLGLSIDSFRFFGGWIALGVGLAVRPPGEGRPPD